MLKKVKKINSFLLTEKPLKRNILHEVSEKYRIYENAVRLAGLFVLEYDILADRMALLNDVEGYEVLKKYDIPVVLENASMALAEFVESGEVSKLQQMHDRLSEGYDFVCDLWFKGKDSHPSFCVRMTYTVVRTHAGKGVRAFGIVQNITNQKKLEEKYAEEQRNLRERKELHLVAKSQSSLTHNCLLYYYSEAPESASLKEGMRYDDIVEMLASWAIRKEDAEACRRVLDRKRLIELLGQGKTSFEFRYQRRQPMQNPVWISFVFNTFQVPHSDEIECFIYTYDISEQFRNAAIVKRISEMAFESVCLIYLSTGQIEFLRTAGPMFTPNRRLDYEEVCRLYRQCYMKEGFDDYISKPVEGEYLEKMICRYLLSENKVNVTRQTEIPPPSNMSGVSLAQGRDERYLDVALGRHFCGDNIVLYEKMQEDFVAEKEEQSDKISKAMQLEDWKSYVIGVHGLKSAAMIIGAAQLSKEAKWLEEAGKKGDAEYIRANHANVMELYDQVVLVCEKEIEYRRDEYES